MDGQARPGPAPARGATDRGATDPPARRPRVVALGGGHGLHAMLSALVLLDVDITAVVTVADDGGSSGRLRREVPGIVPPGDLRMALAALAEPDPSGLLWTKTFQHRFQGQGALAGHPVGNVVLVGLSQVLGDPVAALDAAGELLGARGRVLPMACEPLDFVAQVQGLDEDPDAVRTHPRPGRGRQYTRHRPQCATGTHRCGRLPGGRRGHRRSGPDHLGTRLLVHQRASPPAAAGPGGRHRREPGPATGGSEPCRPGR